MADGDRLWRAGRARRVDDVGQVLRAQAAAPGAVAGRPAQPRRLARRGGPAPCPEDRRPRLPRGGQVTAWAAPRRTSGPAAPPAAPDRAAGTRRPPSRSRAGTGSRRCRAPGRPPPRSPGRRQCRAAGARADLPSGPLGVADPLARAPHGGGVGPAAGLLVDHMVHEPSAGVRGLPGPRGPWERDSRPGSLDRRQAVMPGHGVRPAVPAGGEGQPRLPHGMLALVVDGDDVVVVTGRAALHVLRSISFGTWQIPGGPPRPRGALRALGILHRLTISPLRVMLAGPCPCMRRLSMLIVNVCPRHAHFRYAPLPAIAPPRPHPARQWPARRSGRPSTRTAHGVRRSFPRRPGPAHPSAQILS